MRPKQFVTELAGLLGVPESEVRTIDRVLADNALRERAPGRYGPNIQQVEAIRLLLAVRGARTARRAHFDAVQWAQMRTTDRFAEAVMFASTTRAGGQNVPQENLVRAFGPDFVPEGKNLIGVLNLVCNRCRAGKIDPTFPLDLQLDLTNDVAVITFGTLSPQGELYFTASATLHRNLNRDIAHIDGGVFHWIAAVTGPGASEEA